MYEGTVHGLFWPHYNTFPIHLLEKRQTIKNSKKLKEYFRPVPPRGRVVHWSPYTGGKTLPPKHILGILGKYFTS